MYLVAIPLLAHTLWEFTQLPSSDTLLLPLEHARLIQGMSWWGLGTGILGISHGKVALGSSVCAAAVIAYCYWWRPVNNWRRTLDVFMVRFLVVWHFWYARNSPVKVLYYGISAVGVVLYCLEWHFTDVWILTYLHMAVTACANLSLIVLYTA
jgi:hypothetical protein